MQIQAGIVLAVEKGDRFHTAGVLSIDFGGTFTITADGWFFTEMSKGYFGSGAPQARARLNVNDDGFLAQLCVGPAETPTPGLDCSDLQKLNLYDVAEVWGAAELYIGSDFHLYAGTYPDAGRVKATFFNVFEANGYFMMGMVSNEAKPPTVPAGSYGYWFGVQTKWSINLGDRGSFAFCSWDWYARAGANFSSDFGIQFTPRIAFDANVYGKIWFAVGVHGCGVGVDINFMLEAWGHISAPPAHFDGFVRVIIVNPFKDIDITVKASATL